MLSNLKRSLNLYIYIFIYIYVYINVCVYRHTYTPHGNHKPKTYNRYTNKKGERNPK